MEFEFPNTASVYGLVAEFEHPEEIVGAAKQVREAGYKCFDAYTPFPVHGLSEAVGFTKSRVPFIVLLGGLTGAITGYLLQYYCAAIAYPLNIGGRPLNSIPAFIPVTFEMTILFASLAALLGMFFLNGLPLPYHPLFNVERFALATNDRFFLCIEAKDPIFDREKTKIFLDRLKARGVYEVPM